MFRRCPSRFLPFPYRLASFEVLTYTWCFSCVRHFARKNVLVSWKTDHLHEGKQQTHSSSFLSSSLSISCTLEFLQLSAFLDLLSDGSFYCLRSPSNPLAIGVG
jgi:hypothetical protein